MNLYSGSTCLFFSPFHRIKKRVRKQEIDARKRQLNDTPRSSLTFYLLLLNVNTSFIKTLYHRKKERGERGRRQDRGEPLMWSTVYLINCESMGVQYVSVDHPSLLFNSKSDSTILMESILAEKNFDMSPCPRAITSRRISFRLYCWCIREKLVHIPFSCAP